MCLAVPGKVLDLEKTDPLMRTGHVDFSGIVREVNLTLVPDAEVGNFVVVHAGVAISIVDEVEARRVFDLIHCLDSGDEGGERES